MFVPISEIKTKEPQDKKANEPLFFARRVTLTRKQISGVLGENEADLEHNDLLDCILCKNVMVDPKECKKCNKGFCKLCIQEYIKQLQNGGFDIQCPNCGTKNFQPSEPHPLVMKTLTSLKVACMNADKGCTCKVPYLEMHQHLIECDYAIVKCTNYGCEKEMFQKDYKAHAETCEHRPRTCPKCDFLLTEG